MTELFDGLDQKKNFSMANLHGTNKTPIIMQVMHYVPFIATNPFKIYKVNVSKMKRVEY